MGRTFFHPLANTPLVSVINFTVWFAITFFVYLETRSVFATGVIAGIYLAFTALSGLWFGSLVDHHRKKVAMVVSSAVSLVLYGICFWRSTSLSAGTRSPIRRVRRWGCSRCSSWPASSSATSAPSP